MREAEDWIGLAEKSCFPPLIGEILRYSDLRICVQRAFFLFSCFMIRIVPIIEEGTIAPHLRIRAMKKSIFLVILAILAFLAFLAFLAVWGTEVRAQIEIEATEVIRLYEQVAQANHVPIVKCLDLESHGQLLALGGDDHIVRLWSVPARKFVTELQRHDDWVRSLTFSPDATRLATVAQDGQIRLWNVQEGRLLRTLNEPVRGTQQILFQPDGSRFAVCGFDRNVRIYDAATYRLLATLPAHDTNNEAIAYSEDSSLLAVGGRTGVVRIWRTTDNTHLTDIEGDGRRVRAIAFSPEGSSLAMGGEGPFIMLWNPQDGKLIRTFRERPGKTFALTFCGSTVLASGESDNMVRLWNPATGTQTATLSGHTGTVSTMAYEPKTQKLITGSFDASVRFWHLPLAEQLLLPEMPMPSP